jgi:hypothetical protein
MADYSFDLQEVFTRFIKYIIEGLAVALVAWLLPSKSLPTEEIVLVGLSAAAIFSVLDLLAPSISSTVRGGVGYGFGFRLAGFPA